MRSPLRWLLLTLLGLHVLSAVSVALLSDWDRPGFVTGDSLRYHEIATASGLPYRDHDVEYPPLALAAIEVVARPSDPATAGTLLVLTQLLADLCVVAALAYGWHLQAAIAWLALLLPFCWGGWIFGRLDLLSVALAMWGIALARRSTARAGERGERTGGLLLGLAVFAKAWPLVALPGLALERRRAATTAAIAVVAIGGLAWIVLGGIDGVRQVVTFRDARGWQVESTIGSLLLLDLARPPFLEQNALRIGVQVGWEKLLLAVALVGGIVVAWALAWRTRDRSPESQRPAADLATLVAVGLLLVLSPLLSPQFLVWLVPFVAIRWRDTTMVALTAAAMLVTAWVVRGYAELLEEGRTTLSRLLVLRNALLVAVVVVGFVRLARLVSTKAGAGAVADALSAGDAACTARRTRR